MIDVSNDIPADHNASFLKYLTFIQDVITRMNRNAFQLKGHIKKGVGRSRSFGSINGNKVLCTMPSVRKEMKYVHGF